MMKHTRSEIEAHRDDIINAYYPVGMDDAVLAIHSNTPPETWIYPDLIKKDNRRRLDNEQIDAFMQSTEFDNPLFRTMVDILAIDAAVAFMMSLS